MSENNEIAKNENENESGKEKMQNTQTYQDTEEKRPSTSSNWLLLGFLVLTILFILVEMKFF